MSVSLRFALKAAARFSRAMRPPLNADCSIHLDALEITGGKTVSTVLPR
jgi:hypothetical protein